MKPGRGNKSPTFKSLLLSKEWPCRVWDLKLPNILFVWILWPPLPESGKERDRKGRNEFLLSADVKSAKCLSQARCHMHMTIALGAACRGSASSRPACATVQTKNYRSNLCGSALASHAQALGSTPSTKNKNVAYLECAFCNVSKLWMLVLERRCLGEQCLHAAGVGSAHPQAQWPLLHTAPAFSGCLSTSLGPCWGRRRQMEIFQIILSLSIIETGSYVAQDYLKLI